MAKDSPWWGYGPVFDDGYLEFAAEIYENLAFRMFLEKKSYADEEDLWEAAKKNASGSFHSHILVDRAKRQGITYLELYRSLENEREQRRNFYIN